MYHTFAPIGTYNGPKAQYRIIIPVHRHLCVLTSRFCKYIYSRQRWYLAIEIQVGIHCVSLSYSDECKRVGGIGTVTDKSGQVSRCLSLPYDRPRRECLRGGNHFRNQRHLFPPFHHAVNLTDTLFLQASKPPPSAFCHTNTLRSPKRDTVAPLERRAQSNLWIP